MGKKCLIDWRILFPILFGEILVVESIIATVRDRQDVPDVRQSREGEEVAKGEWIGSRTEADLTSDVASVTPKSV